MARTRPWTDGWTAVDRGTRGGRQVRLGSAELTSCIGGQELGTGGSFWDVDSLRFVPTST